MRKRGDISETAIARGNPIKLMPVDPTGKHPHLPEKFGWIAGYRAIKQLTSEFDLAVRAGAGAQLVAGSEVRSIASWENTVKGLAQDPWLP